MPYIDELRRDHLDNVEHKDTETPGELNYVLTRQCLDHLVRNYHHIGYTQYNEIIGVLECMKLEFYRRAVAPYEDKKIVENGDVY